MWNGSHNVLTTWLRLRKMDVPKTPEVRISSRLPPAKNVYSLLSSRPQQDDDNDFLNENEPSLNEQMEAVMRKATTTPTACKAQGIVERTLRLLLQDHCEQNRLRFLNAVFYYGMSLWEEELKYFQKNGFKTILVCHESDGSTIFDSSTEHETGKFWSVVQQEPNGIYKYTHVALRTPQPFTFDETKPSLEDYRLNTRVYVPLYGIMSSPHKDFLSGEDANVFGRQDMLLSSAFLRNQCIHPCTMACIQNIVKTTTNENGVMSFYQEELGVDRFAHHVCRMLDLFADHDGSALGATLFIRLSLIPI